MIFESFFDEFPEFVTKEFRNITVLNNNCMKYIPPGNYAFLEMFCPDIDCDCRKVIINVISANPFKTWATFHYGWESEKFYKKWWGKNLEDYKPMSGLHFDPPTKDRLKNEFLLTFADHIKNDQNYAERIKRHYFMFKEKMLKKQFKKNAKECLLNSSNHKKIKRDDPCPCNSGKKFKKCCLLTIN